MRAARTRHVAQQQCQRFQLCRQQAAGDDGGFVAAKPGNAIVSADQPG